MYEWMSSLVDMYSNTSKVSVLGSGERRWFVKPSLFLLSLPKLARERMIGLSSRVVLVASIIASRGELLTQIGRIVDLCYVRSTCLRGISKLSPEYFHSVIVSYYCFLTIYGSFCVVVCEWHSTLWVCGTWSGKGAKSTLTGRIDPLRFPKENRDDFMMCYSRA